MLYSAYQSFTDDDYRQESHDRLMEAMHEVCERSHDPCGRCAPCREVWARWHCLDDEDIDAARIARGEVVA